MTTATRKSPQEIVADNLKFVADHGIKTQGEFHKAILEHRLAKTICIKCGA
jgi:hypothetical protein